MVVLHQVGESIECDKCEVISRNIVPSILQVDEILGRVMKYNCERNSSAKNIQELNPKVFRYKFSSNLNLGTELRAKGIYLLTTKIRPVKKKTINHTGRHKAQLAVFDDYVFSEIRYPLENVIHSMRVRELE